LGDDVTTQTTSVTQEMIGETTTVAVVTKQNRQIGTVSFPPNSLKVGWTIIVEPIAQQPPEPPKKKHGDCGSSQDSHSYDLASTPFELRVLDQNGHEVHSFLGHKQITLTSFTDAMSGSEDHHEMCFGFSRSTPWKCMPHTDFEKTKSEGLLWAETKSDHLTTFAVLLQAGGGDDGGVACHRPYWIATLALIGTAVALGIMALVALRYSIWFRSVVYGYDSDKGIESVLDKIKSVNNKDDVEQSQRVRAV